MPYHPQLQIPLEYALLVAIVSASFAIVFGQANLRRNRKLDDQLSANLITRLEVKLEHIDKGVGLIHQDMRDIKQQINEHRERIALVEATAGQAHKRLDELAGRRPV